MANVLGELFQDIADAIRSKTGSTDTLKPNEFPAAIEGITAGGGSSADVRYVTFMNRSGTKEYGKKAVAYGDDCADPIARGIFDTPTEESTAQFHFTFSGGWATVPNGGADANALKAVTEDRVVYANFIETLRYYTITWLDSDGVTELPGQKQWAYGTVPSYTPTKEGASFDGWTPSPVYVTGDATYTAKWIEVIGGSCGDAANWMFDVSIGTLTIYGTGEMSNYSTPSDVPWGQYVSLVKRVVIEDGITNLGWRTCYGMSNLTEFLCPETCNMYGTYTFFGCSSLETIHLSEATSVLGDYMFANCTGLKTFTIPDQVTRILTYTFNGCNSLESVVFEDSESTWKRMRRDTYEDWDYGFKVNDPAANAVRLVSGLVVGTYKLMFQKQT